MCLGPLLIPGLLVNRHIVHVGSYLLFTQSLEQDTALPRCHMVNIEVKGTASFSAEITGYEFGPQCFKVTMSNLATSDYPAFQIQHLA